MLPINYVICSNQMNTGVNSKVFKIREINPPNRVYVVKIFDETRNQEYEDERAILLLLSNNNNSQNDYLIKLKNIDIRLEYNDIYTINSRLLVFDYLIHGTIDEYLLMMPNINLIKEKYVKLICYKLLFGLKKCHENNICHNNINIKNIMFDNDFNPIIINFNEALLINDSNFKKDFFGLGIVLAKLITSGYFSVYGFDKKTKKYVFKCKLNNNKKDILEENTFWNIFETINNIKISNEFKKFFELLVKSKNQLNIDELINHEWLKEIINNKNEIEKQLKEEFQTNYNEIMKSKSQDTYNLDINSILDIPQTQNNNDSSNSLINEYLAFGANEKISSFDRIRSLEEEEITNYEDKFIKTIQNEPIDIQFNYIEINIEENNYFFIKALDKFMMDLQKNIKEYKYEQKLDIIVEPDAINWAFTVSFEENDINEESEEEEIDLLYEDIDDSNLIPLIIKIELFKLEKEQKDIDLIKPLNQKYYLMFNFIQGNIADFYEYLRIIKMISISLLNH